MTANSTNSWRKLANAQGLALEPADLLHWIAKRPAKRGACIECGAGHGELASFFRPHFDITLATDLAPPARKSPYGVTVIKAGAESLPVPAASVDLLISMQALHHFDLNPALSEASRVLRQGGIFAALSWGEISLPDQIQTAYAPVFKALAPFWEADRDWVISGYKGLNFTGKPLSLPKAQMRRQMTLADLDAEIHRWSASRAAAAARVDLPKPQLAGFDPRPFTVHWPLLGQIFQV